MKGNPGLLRICVGDYRVVYRVNQAEQVILVRGINARGQVYKGRRIRRP